MQYTQEGYEHSYTLYAQYYSFHLALVLCTKFLK